MFTLLATVQVLVALKRGFACKNGVPHLTAITSPKVHKEIILKVPLLLIGVIFFLCMLFHLGF